MQTQIITLVLAIWAAIHPGLDKLGAAPEIANAISVIVEQDADKAPVYGSHAEDAAIMAYWAYRESTLNTRAVGDGGVAHGVWQLHSACGNASVLQQARCWMSMLREGKRICPDAPAAPLSGGCRQARKLVDRRVPFVRYLLRTALAKLAPEQPVDEEPTAGLDAGTR